MFICVTNWVVRQLQKQLSIIYKQAGRQVQDEVQTGMGHALTA